MSEVKNRLIEEIKEQGEVVRKLKAEKGDKYQVRKSVKFTFVDSRYKYHFLMQYGNLTYHSCLLYTSRCV